MIVNTLLLAGRVALACANRSAIMGALALACFFARPASASPIFGLHQVASQHFGVRPAHRHHRASRARHHRFRPVVRHPDAGGLEGWGGGEGFGSSSLLSVARNYLGRGNFTGYREAWCADALRAWLRRGGYSISGTDHRAISFARYGRPTSAHVGAVAVMWHHVGIVAGFANCSSGWRTPERAPNKCGGVLLLSGNHGRRVAYGVYPLRRIVAFREPV